MLKSYTYNPQDAGLAEWPSGILRLERMEPASPQDADVFIVPGNLSIFKAGGTVDRSKLERLPHFKGNESRHVFLDVSDNFTKPLNLPCMFIRCDARSWMLDTDPNTINLAWPVDDFAECINTPTDGFKYDLSFHGWNWSPARKQAIESLNGDRRIHSDFATYRDFFGHLNDSAEQERRRIEFKRSMQESRLALCPESIPGVFPYRFWEAMSAARVPVLVGSDFVFPFADEIPYSCFILQIPKSDSPRANWAVADFLKQNSDEELIRKGQMAREAWEKWLNRDRWPELMTYAVKKQFNAVLEARSTR